MARPRLVVVREDGTLVVEGEAASASTPPELKLASLSGRYLLYDTVPGLLLMQAVDAPEDRRRRLLAAGEILGETSVMELVSMVAAQGLRGELQVHDGALTRRLMFDQGALKWAFSNAPNERLGEVMVSLGVITPDQLARVVLSVNPQRRFGEIAIEQGYVDRNMLFEMLQAQAQRIFQGALLTTEGCYSLTLPLQDDEVPSMTVHMPVQALLFESVQRIDEMAHFRREIPSADVVPRPTANAGRITIDPSLQGAAMLIDGRRTIAEIGRELHLDEFEITKQVAQLLQAGFAEIEEPRALDQEAVERMLRQLNEILREVRDTVERYGGRTEMLWTLKAWVRDSDIARYFGPSMRLDGDISVEQTLETLRQLDSDAPLEQLHRACHELVSFAMFAASPTLPREAEKALSKWVNQRIARMRL